MLFFHLNISFLYFHTEELILHLSIVIIIIIIIIIIINYLFQFAL